MKGSMLALLALAAGCLTGYSLPLPAWLTGHTLSTWLLYALMAQVGLSMGGSGQLGQLLRHVSARALILPLATIIGTLSFTALAAWLTPWRPTDCLGRRAGHHCPAHQPVPRSHRPGGRPAAAAPPGPVRRHQRGRRNLHGRYPAHSGAKLRPGHRAAGPAARRSARSERTAAGNPVLPTVKSDCRRSGIKKVAGRLPNRKIRNFAEQSKQVKP